MDLTLKTVVITGASSGIGKACAEAFAARGANIVAGARKYLALCEITAEIEKKYGVKAVAVQCDVSKEGDCEQLIRQAILTFGGIDVLVNNAGITMRAIFKDTEVTVLKKVMDVNFWGTVYCSKYALPELLKTCGSVVGVSSIAGFHGLPGRTGYSASKFAMQGFLEALRVENLKTGLHVMVVAPGFTSSNIRKLALSNDGSEKGESNLDEKKLMSSEEVAGRIVKGVASRKRTLVMTGNGKLVVLLDKFTPAWLDTLIFNHFRKENDPLI